MTKAIILAAGQGTRLRPITNDKPKCLTPLDGQTLLARQANVLRREGINDITVIGGYRIDQIKALGYRCIENPDFESTNMVATLFCASELMTDDEDLLICYGDIIYEPKNLTTVLKQSGDVVLMVDKEWRRLWELRLDNPLDDAETLKLNSQGQVLELGKVPKDYTEIEGQYTGLIKISGHKLKDFLAHYNQLDQSALYDGQSFDNMYMTSLIQQLIDSGWSVQAAAVNNGWLEIDSVTDLEIYQTLQDRGELGPYCDLDA